MHLFRAVMDCHHRLLLAAEALRDELDEDEPTPKLLRLRFAMATAARDNLAATQRLWSRIEREIPDVQRRIPAYDRLKAVESDLHVRYAHHIAAWPVAAISADFPAFARAKRRFLADLCRHTHALETDFFQPACQMMGDEAKGRVRAA